MQTFDHRVANENRPQTRLVVEFGLERKDAKHEIEIARHLRNPAAIPGPNLWADVVNNLPVQSPKPSVLVEGSRESQIETWIVNQDHRIRLNFVNLRDGAVELSSEIRVVLDHVPKPDHGRAFAPINEVATCDRFHARASTTVKTD